MKRELLMAVSLLAGCGARSSAPFKGDLGLSHGGLPEAWRPTTVPGTSAAWYQSEFGATIGVAVACEDVSDMSLHALAQQTLVGIERRETLEQSILPVDGREAESWVVKGSLDGIPILIHLVVFRKGPCVYDFELVAKPASFESARADFRAFLVGLTVGKK